MGTKFNETGRGIRQSYTNYREIDEPPYDADIINRIEIPYYYIYGKYSRALNGCERLDAEHRRIVPMISEYERDVYSISLGRCISTKLLDELCQDAYDPVGEADIYDLFGVS